MSEPGPSMVVKIIDVPLSEEPLLLSTMDAAIACSCWREPSDFGAAAAVLKRLREGACADEELSDELPHARQRPLVAAERRSTRDSMGRRVSA